MKIRASMLPAWPDCPRRGAAKQYRKTIEGAGFPLRELEPSVGAAVGTAVHKAVCSKLVGVEEWLEAGLQSFEDETAPGAIWDDTTPHAGTAGKQIDRMARATLLKIEQEEIKPVLIEQEWTRDSPRFPGWTLTGHCDLVTEGEILDIKTGAVHRPYWGQLGGYALLSQAQNLNITKLGILWVKRCAAGKPQAPAEMEWLDMRASVEVAKRTISDIAGCVTRFQETQDPGEFIPNPMSMMCVDKYCPAHSTKFCQYGR